MDVQFREFDPFNLWIWLEFSTVPAPMEKQYVEELFDSWFYLGKLGGFNAENMQVMEAGIDLSYMDYDLDVADRSLMSPMHNMGEFEYHQNWGRCWFDLGTSDPFALDVLLNSLAQLSKDYVTIEQILIGGANEDWPVNAKSDALFYENTHN